MSISPNSIASQLRAREVIGDFAKLFLTHLDCDGCTRLVSILLDNLGIEHNIYSGIIYETKNKLNTFPLHYWIITGQGIIFDFKSEKWLGVTFEYVTYQNIMLLDKSKFMECMSPFAIGVLMICGRFGDNKNGIFINKKKIEAENGNGIS